MNLVAMLLLLLVYLHETCVADGLFFGPLLGLAFLPYTIIFNIAGIAGVKLAIAVKLLGLFGWWRAGISEATMNRQLDWRALPTPIPLQAGDATLPGLDNLPLHMIPGILGEIVRSMLQDDNVGMGFFQRAVRKEDPSFTGRQNKTPFSYSEWERLRRTQQLLAKLRRHASRSRAANMTEFTPALDLIHEMDVDDCMLKLSCEVGAEPARYGSYGRRVASFVQELGSLGGNGSSFQRYQAAFEVGRMSRLSLCGRLYPNCQYDLVALTMMVDKNDWS
ncbi:unnamed protein product [Ixodes hexagonus]